ncbi:hypothetical protein WH50_20770 [Pokkaliibacter plantistimulans]|uniref:Uncharacterized protein n=1 Tax=Pokkaliibacter plantistimulans TaxID=1635171 RepID=A0ABX5LXK8_9GAMM|nr:hypothetical protein WH50_20770 [Pokkaliibacter plantistimulans]
MAALSVRNYRIQSLVRQTENGLGVWITASVEVDVSLEIELSTAPLVTLEQEKAHMKSTSNSNIMKNVKSGIAALLGCLVVDSISSESQAKNATVVYLGVRHGGSIPPTPSTLNKRL